MNDSKFLANNQTGILKRLNKGSVAIPKEIREQCDIEMNSMIEIIPLHEGFYIRRAMKKQKGE